MFNPKFSWSVAVLAVTGATSATVAISAPVQALSIVNSVNANSNPAAGTFWGVNEVGWVYTPTSSYALDGIYTKFGSLGSARTVTVEIYSGAQ